LGAALTLVQPASSPDRPIALHLRLFLLAAFCFVSQHAAAISSVHYFPLPTDAMWSYAVSDEDPETPDTTETRTVTGIRTLGGQFVMIVRDQAGRERYFSNDSGVRFHGLLRFGITDEHLPPWILLAEDATVGTPLQRTGRVDPAILNYSATTTLLGIEPTFTVPAGTFTDVLHVRLVVDLGNGFATETHEMWLAPGVGPVQEKRSGWRDGPLRTWQLTEYSVPDTFPDEFAFAPKTVGGFGGAQVVSDEITVAGIDGPAPIRISGDPGAAYQIHGGAFTELTGLVSAGNRIRVQLRSPNPGLSASATLDIGGRVAPFIVTTQIDDMPDAFSFRAVTGAPLATTIYSDPVPVTGRNAPVPISIVGGEYSVGGLAFAAEPGTVCNSCNVEVRLTSAAGYGATASATVTIGGVSAVFSVTTQVPGEVRTILFWRSEPLNYMGEGRNKVINIGSGEPQASMEIGGSAGGPGITAGFYPSAGLDARLGLLASGARALTPGRYEGAQTYPGGDAPILQFSRFGRFCTASGRFDVLELGYAANDEIERAAVNFEHRCEGDPSPLLGQMRFNSRVPLDSNVVIRNQGDFNADSRSDVLWRNSASGENYLYPMNGATILSSEGYLRTVSVPDWRIVASGDFDGDGKADILWRNASTGENYLYVMDGLSIANEGYLRTVADQSWIVAGVGDFDGNGRDDIFWRNTGSGENYVYLMNGIQIAGEGYVRTVADNSWEVAGVADFDGDGKADVLWRRMASGENYLYLMDGIAIKPSEGYLRTVADQSWQIKGVGDFDGDGTADIAWRNTSTGENYIYFMDGLTIKPSEGYLRTVPNGAWQIVATGDYDGDGKSDILWRNSSTGENYLYPMDGIVIKPSEGYLRSVTDQNWQPQR